MCPVPAHPGGSQPAEPVTAHRPITPGIASPAPADPPTEPVTGPETPVPAAPDVVYLVAGGDMIAAFADEASADIQDTVMIGAGLDTTRSRLAWTRWTQVRAELRRRHPEIEIVDVIGAPS